MTPARPVTPTQLTSAHVIVIAPEAPPAVRTAARELREHLRAIAGLELEISDAAGAAGEPAREQEILIGDSARLRAVAPDWQLTELGPEEYRLRIAGGRLLIAGRTPRATLYGVYGYLREHLGCRWFTPDCQVLPPRATIPLAPVDERRAPAFEYRNFILNGVADPAWAARNGYNGFNSPDDLAHGGHLAHWHYGHSLFALCPAEQYFASHPEYFDSGSRAKQVRDDYVNLCFTNDAVVGIVAANLRQAMAEAAAKQAANPAPTQPTVFYLAQHDGGSPCRCPGCEAIITAEGALSAPLIYFCNRVLAALGDEFPQYRVMTIAYRFSRRPPRTLRPDPRLIVQVCSIECCQAHPYATCDDPDDRLFREDLAGWRALTDNLWVWDYMPRLWHPFLTGPGFAPMAANYRWFQAHGVRGMFTQTGGERDFKWLNAYLMCAMMRDPRQDWQALRDEFMDAYYGPAATPLRAFLAAVQDSVVTGNHHLHYKEGTVKPFFSPAVQRVGDQCFAEAAALVRHDPKQAARVRDEYMHFLATKLQHACRDSVLHACHLVAGRLHFDRSPAMAREVAEFTAWKAETGRLAGQGYTRAKGESCTTFVETDLVTLDNGTLALEFLPRLAGRQVGLRQHASGHNYLHLAPGEGTAFNLANGYREEWLAAPGAYEQESASGWSRRAGESAGSTEASAAVSVAGAARASAQVFETGGKFMHPLQWERWTRLAASGGSFHLESMLVNRGIHPVNAAVASYLPLDLGELAELQITDANGEAIHLALGNTAGDPGPSDAAILAGTLTPAQAAGGLVLRHPRRGLALHWRATGEIIAQVHLLADPAAQRLTLQILTKPEILTPGAGRRFCQHFELPA